MNDEILELIGFLCSYLAGAVTLPDSHMLLMCETYPHLEFKKTVEVIEGAIGLYAAGTINEAQISG